MSSGLYKKGHFVYCHVNGLILHPQKGSGLSSARWTCPLPSRLRALGIMGVGSSRIRRGGGRERKEERFCWLWLRPVLESQGPNLKVCPQTRRALLFPCGSSDVKFCCWGNVIGREPVETGLSVKSGNGRIWKHLAVCTDGGGAVAHKRLLFRVNLPNPFCSSNLCLVHMTFFTLYACVVLGLLQK